MSTEKIGLTCGERWSLGVIGLAMFGVAGCVLYWPPMHIVAPAQAESGPTISVSSDPVNVILAMLAVATLFFFIAMNGRRVASVKLLGGVEVSALAEEAHAAERTLAPKIKELSDQETEEEPNSQPQATPSKTVQVDGVELGVYSLDAVPVRVLQDFLSDDNAKNLPFLFAVEFVAKRSGRGNYPWAIKFRGDERVWKVSYGGKSKTGATVTLLTP